MTNRKSFKLIEESIKSYMDFALAESVRNIVLVANKSDMAAQREVSFEEAVNLAKKYSLAGVIETSAKDGLKNIDDCFYIALLNAYDKRQS
jgi:GTPase SAR1 family protein